MFTNEVNSALQTFVAQRYQQIVQVNLTKHTCKVLWSSDLSENTESTFYLDRLWNSSKLYPNDVKMLRKLHNIEFVKKNIAEKSSLCYKFRQRKVGKTVEWMQIEIVKDDWYSERNVELLIFVKNIEDSYGKEYKAKKEAERLAKIDTLTGFYNRLAFNIFCNSKKYSSVGVVYVDLNRLKKVNDTEGHTAGDKYIQFCCSKIRQSFSSYKKYRVGGDEFVIVAIDVPSYEFIEHIVKFSQSIDTHDTAMPICSFGYSWSNDPDVSIDKIIKNAEHDMYTNKEENYLKYHTDRRHTS